MSNTLTLHDGAVDRAGKAIEWRVRLCRYVLPPWGDDAPERLGIAWPDVGKGACPCPERLYARLRSARGARSVPIVPLAFALGWLAERAPRRAEMLARLPPEAFGATVYTATSARIPAGTIDLDLDRDPADVDPVYDLEPIQARVTHPATVRLERFGAVQIRRALTAGASGGTAEAWAWDDIRRSFTGTQARPDLVRFARRVGLPPCVWRPVLRRWLRSLEDQKRYPKLHTQATALRAWLDTVPPLVDLGDEEHP